LKVRHWDPEEYLGCRKGGKRGGEDLVATDKPTSSILSSFMEGEDGSQVSDKTKMAAWRSAKGFFEQLLKDNSAPAAWGSAPLSIQHELINILETGFPFLRFCEGHWKANQVATNSYSQWYQHAINHKAAVKAKKLRKATEDDDQAQVIDIDSSENDNCHNATFSNLFPYLFPLYLFTSSPCFPSPGLYL
jgi:transcription termination factor Rho